MVQVQLADGGNGLYEQMIECLGILSEFNIEKDDSNTQMYFREITEIIEMIMIIMIFF